LTPKDALKIKKRLQQAMYQIGYFGQTSKAYKAARPIDDKDIHIALYLLKDCSDAEKTAINDIEILKLGGKISFYYKET